MVMHDGDGNSHGDGQMGIGDGGDGDSDGNGDSDGDDDGLWWWSWSLGVSVWMLLMGWDQAMKHDTCIICTQSQTIIIPSPSHALTYEHHMVGDMVHRFELLDSKKMIYTGYNQGAILVKLRMKNVTHKVKKNAGDGGHVLTCCTPGRASWVLRGSDSSQSQRAFCGYLHYINTGIVP